ncbi:glycoside hydrolase family 3 protein [Alteromonas sp. ASW11-130]|uniref:glycoside hydrolase family 3 protein n=1 Tax=Alteromonas sp. ASW11-130 TaxID=3015775 RepID=UPI0022428920|nr:glycoside hydrolase family 3 protein [Alteromonas sp. ASW11-130]MCW8090844.1 glycoside hydrolase family 3 protein [Alteromonas sp. ASW11-130]
MKPLSFVISTLVLLLLLLCTKQGLANSSEESYEHMIGQKIMLDFRYYCAEKISGRPCNEPVLGLTDDVADILVTGQIGGVILFSENIQSIEQVITFIYDMQALMQKHSLPPLFIAVDQEGGRVARFPDQITTRFVGNMAIGATFEKFGTEYATSVAAGIAQAMNLLGVNVNFAPNVDVNVNPANPVINVRSYGESPAVVAELGLATVRAFQQQHLISAIKHFPGHGDTHVDSHSGLPRVDHTRTEIEAKDIFPFRTIIGSKTPPAMVMSAHIQYPALDDSEIMSKTGKKTIVPATLSRKILYDLLRKDLSFEGVIVTDALDMQAISQFFTQADAALHAFKAGADIALMPYMIRTKSDIKGFWKWQQRLVQALRSGKLDKTELLESASRIKKLKQQFEVGRILNESKKERIKQAKDLLPIEANKKLEKQLAKHSITRLTDNDILPLSEKQGWEVVMPDKARCDAFIRSVKKSSSAVKINCTSLAAIPAEPIHVSKNKVLVVGDITPLHSAYEMGGMDPTDVLIKRASNQQQHEWILSTMQNARANNVPVIFVALRAPYIVSDFAPYIDSALATYGYNVEVRNNVASGAVYESIVEVLLGTTEPKGQLPVTVELHSK